MAKVAERWRISAAHEVPKHPWFMALVCASVVGILIRIHILRGSAVDILQHFGSDDLFYYTQVAHFWATQGIPSFDGTHVTTGVQPLFTLFLMPFAPFFDGNPLFALRVNLGLSSLFTLILAWQIPGLMRSIFGNYWGYRAGTIAAALWLLHPRLLDVTFQGTEAALAALCWVLSMRFWLRSNGSIRSNLLLGLVLGVGFLARVDHVFLAATLILFPARTYVTPWMTRVTVASLGFLVMVSPWLLYCWVLTGSPMQDSGGAKRLQYQHVHSTQIAESTAEYVATGKPTRWSYWLDRWKALPIPLLSTNGVISVFSLAGWLIFVIGVFKLIIFRPEGLPPFQTGLKNLDAFFEAPFEVLIFYTFFYGYLRLWYYTPVFLIMSLVVGTAWAISFVPLCPGRKIHQITLFFTIWMLLAFGLFMRGSKNFTWESHYVLAAAKLQMLTPEDARIGAFNAGIQGAFVRGNRQIVNLDGVVNHGALTALREKTLTEYLDREGIDYLIDHQGSPAFYEAMGAPGLVDRLNLVETYLVPERSDQPLCLWRINRSQRAKKLAAE